MNDLIERIRDMCSFYPSTIKYMDQNKDWVDLRQDDTESFSDMIFSAEAVSHRENLH